MKLAADFRRIAREVLNGKWKIAVLVGLVATLLGAVEGMGPDVNVTVEASNVNASFNFAGQTLYSTGGGLNSDIGAFLAGGMAVIMVAAVIAGALYFVLGSVIKVGYAKFNLTMVDGQEGSFDPLFAYFPHWTTTALASFLQGLYIFLWSLLFLVPGIVATYSYAMTEYILAEHPELTATEAIRRSKEMMEGNRWRLFCLQFSFIGWDLLCSLTLGIGHLWLTPYRKAATAAFYREVSGTEQVTSGNEWNAYHWEL